MAADRGEGLSKALRDGEVGGLAAGLWRTQPEQASRHAAARAGHRNTVRPS